MLNLVQKMGSDRPTHGIQRMDVLPYVGAEPRHTMLIYARSYLFLHERQSTHFMYDDTYFII